MSAFSSVRSSDALSDAASTVTIATSPSPIMSAEAVDAVRRGLRMAFSRPSLPWIPRRRIGAPITPASGRAPSGNRIAMPTNVAAAPRPISEPAFDWLPNSP